MDTDEASARSVIHEMRNHLTVAVALIEAFVDKKLEPTALRLTGIYKALAQIDALIDDLRPESKQPLQTRAETIDVCALIDLSTAALDGLAVQRGVNLRTRMCKHSEAGCNKFSGDPVRIDQAISNVLINAINYSAPGSTVEVDCRRDGDGLRFRVTDQGPGIPEGERQKIFELGYRGTASQGITGSGIGLALARRCVESHSGTIEVEAGAGAGTAFTMRLPVTSPGQQRSPNLPCNGSLCRQSAPATVSTRSGVRIH